MKMIHFCSYFQGSKVYSNLFSFLSKNGVTNNIFIPVRGREKVDYKNSNFFFSRCLSKSTRFFYWYKLFRVNSAASEKLGMLPVENHMIHAHTLYADGIPAYRFARKRGLPLIITIRTTDATLGFRYYFHYKWLAKKALKYANKIVFVAPAHKLKFQQYFGNCFDYKLDVIPNGIDEFYIENRLRFSVHKDNNVALYVGAINKNKNLKSVITAFFNVSQNNDDVFRVVGGSYKDYVNVYGELPVNLLSKVQFLGRLSKVQVLEQMRASSLFVMVSHSETFGLVYIEAISQCLPIVYTSGQGVDGYFADGEYGFKANSRSVESISTAIKNTLNKFPNGLGPFEENPAASFSWSRIAKVYMEEVYK